LFTKKIIKKKKYNLTLLKVSQKRTGCKRMLTTAFLFFFMVFFTCSTYAQLGGKRSFEFLNIPANARLAALGRVNVSVADNDVAMFFTNPALLQTGVDNHLALNYQHYIADIGYTSLAYGRDADKYGVWAIGLNHLNYGQIEGFDETGQELGSFNANDYALFIGNAHTIGNFTLGANLKLAGSNLAGFSAHALLMDMGGAFIHPEKPLSIGLVIKNFGVMLNDFTPEHRSRLPFDVQAGVTYKPEHMPLRFSFTAYNLSRGESPYFDAQARHNLNKEQPGTVDRIFRHLSVGTEILLSNNVHLRAGYNHLLRQELRLEQATGGAGFSLGMMFRVKAFEFAYTRGFYHTAAGSNYFSLMSNLNTFFK
jgi:hypothetical protein